MPLAPYPSVTDSPATAAGRSVDRRPKACRCSRCPTLEVAHAFDRATGTWAWSVVQRSRSGSGPGLRRGMGSQACDRSGASGRGDRHLGRRDRAPGVRKRYRDARRYPGRHRAPVHILARHVRHDLRDPIRDGGAPDLRILDEWLRIHGHLSHVRRPGRLSLQGGRDRFALRVGGRRVPASLWGWVREWPSGWRGGRVSFHREITRNPRERPLSPLVLGLRRGQ